MLKISVEEATINFKHLLEQVAKGEKVILLEENQVVARYGSSTKQRTAFS